LRSTIAIYLFMLRAVTTFAFNWSLDSCGVVGYSYFLQMPLIDGLINAAMILTGMGPVDKMETTAGKLFATVYTLYSGLAFLSMVAIIIAPIYHRFLHQFHLDEE